MRDVLDISLPISIMKQLIINPKIAGLTKQPTNVFANKIKRKLDEKEKIVKIKEFAKEFDLVVFTNNNYSYSKAFKLIIINFANTHGFPRKGIILIALKGWQLKSQVLLLLQH